MMRTTKSSNFPKASKAQASIDLLVSYGIAILLVSIAIFVLLQLGVFNSRLAPTYCNAAPSFTCTAVAISARTGVLTLVFAQSTGATFKVVGASCSTQQTTNSLNSSGPRYGNVNLLPQSTAPSYYPNNQLSSGLTLYSSNQTRIQTYCYGGPNNKLAKGALGTAFTGFVWINYTISSLPGNYYNTQQIVSVSSKYT
jgi:hypothetical protein